MTYQELLETKEWREKCINILKRDNHRCKKCGCFGYHPQSYYECDDIQSLRVILNDFYINDLNIVDFIQGEYDQNTGFLKSKAKAYKVYNLANSTYQTKISRESNDMTFEKLPTVFVSSKEKIYNCENEDGEEIDILYKHYSRGWDDKFNLYDNSIKIDFKNSFTNIIEIASAFKFNRQICNKCILSVWKEPMTGGYWDGFDVTYVSSIVMSITYNNFCFTIYLFPEDYSDNSNPIITRGLNVHHQYYIKSLKPWEYEDDALITLCENCHKSLHKTQNIPVYRNAKIAEAFIGNAEICDKCGGSGYLPQYDYYMDGVCFRCGGEGVILPY